MSYVKVKSTGKIYSIEDVLDKEHEPRLVNNGYYIEDNYHDGRVDIYQLMLIVDPWRLIWTKVEDGVDVEHHLFSYVVE